MNEHNPVENKFIACRTTSDFKGRMESYAQHKDLNISQIVRRGVTLLMENEPVSPVVSGWSIQR